MNTTHTLPAVSFADAALSAQASVIRSTLEAVLGSDPQPELLARVRATYAALISDLDPEDEPLEL